MLSALPVLPTRGGAPAFEQADVGRTVVLASRQGWNLGAHHCAPGPTACSSVPTSQEPQGSFESPSPARASRSTSRDIRSAWSARLWKAMGAAFRILGDVLVYRIRKLEMANLVAVVAILVALRRPIDDTVVRTGFAVLLNLLAYLTNDYCDLEHDLATGREREKTLFLYEHRSAALWVQV